jgi:O-antigen/teichoic acid export membrane protein
MVGSFFLISTNNPTYLSEVFIYGFIVLAIVSSLLLIYFFRKLDGTYTKSSFTYKEISVKSYPIAISGMAMFLLMSFDVFFLKKYRDDATVAYYGIAVKIMTLLTMIILTVNITISAKISEFFAAKNSIELNAITKKSSRLIFLLTAPTALLMCLLAPYLLSVFGTNYEQAHDALLILIIGQTISSLFGSAGVYLNMTGRQSTFQWTLVIAVIINFVLNRLLIPDYGMIGAAMAFVMSTLFWNTLVSIIIYRVDKVKVYLN